MVFTNIPSQIFRALTGVNDVNLALTFLIINAILSFMDTGPRSAFLATIILPSERTAVMGALNVVKTMAQSVGPVLTGVLVERNLFWVAFVLSGVFKTLYNIGLLGLFKEKEKEKEKAERQRIREQEERRNDSGGSQVDDPTYSR
ncbi:hypothetical protein M426DRAFT_316065 [Hypoxylon sp. CI-4A]|nr:hypothetical protein M426DRAFT_316065 [Hypoxylon sp. CI-4A]